MILRPLALLVSFAALCAALFSILVIAGGVLVILGTHYLYGITIVCGGATFLFVSYLPLRWSMSKLAPVRP
jgi:hypothetical protein